MPDFKNINIERFSPMRHLSTSEPTHIPREPRKSGKNKFRMELDPETGTYRKVFYKEEK